MRFILAFLAAFLLSIGAAYAPLMTGLPYGGGVGWNGIYTLSNATPTSFSYTSGITSGTTIGTATATVTPQPLASISYSLSGTSAADFTIGSSTGVITANGSTPTCSSSTPYSLNVVATETGVSNSPTTTAITITCMGAAVAFDALTSANTGVQTAATMTSNGLTVGSGSSRAMLALVSFGDSTSLPAGLACSWDAGGSPQSMTAISGTTTTNGGLSSSSELFGLLSPTSGNKQLTCTWTGNHEADLSAISFTGVNQGSIAAAFPNGTSLSNASTASPISLPITSASGHQVVALFGQNCATWGAVSGTASFANGGGTNLGVISAYNSGAATVTMTAAYSGSCAQIAAGTDVSP